MSVPDSQCWHREMQSQRYNKTNIFKIKNGNRKQWSGIVVKYIPWVADGREVRAAAFLGRKMPCFLIFSYAEFHRRNRISQENCI